MFYFYQVNQVKADVLINYIHKNPDETLVIACDW